MDWGYLPDRRWIQTEYLPAVSGKLLYVGVENCTDFYHWLTPAEYHTIDIDPDRAQFGSPKHHYVGDVLDHVGRYDHVACYGILGYYVLEDFHKFHAKLGELVRPGGTLMLGHHNYPITPEQWAETIYEEYPTYEVLVKAPPGVTTNYIWWATKPS